MTRERTINRLHGKKKNKKKRKHCHKVFYKTEAEAEQALEDFGRARGCIKVYRCSICELWHLTSLTDKQWQHKQKFHNQ